MARLEARAPPSSIATSAARSDAMSRYDDAPEGHCLQLRPGHPAELGVVHILVSVTLPSSPEPRDAPPKEVHALFLELQGDVRGIVGPSTKGLMHADAGAVQATREVSRQ